MIWHYICDSLSTHGVASEGVQCAENIPIEVPNDRAHATYLLDSFMTVDLSVLAAIVAVHQVDANK